jgi:small subunit ribosomal protein S21
MTLIVLRPNETAQSAYRRLQKILDRSGVRRELRERERYEKPSAVKRRARIRAMRRK